MTAGAGETREVGGVREVREVGDIGDIGEVGDIGDEALVRLATELGREASRAGVLIVTAESCTGGLLARVLTETAGSSDWFERGFVTYSNASKSDLLGVRPATLQGHGAVSEAVAREMAEGALRHSLAALALSVTGLAGPGGAVAGKPVGTVCFGWGLSLPAGSPTLLVSGQQHFAGDRGAVRRLSAAHALVQATRMLRKRLLDQPPAA